MTDYDESQVLAAQADIRAAYLAAGRPLNPFDDASVVWSNRTTWDAHELGWLASRAKHLAELKAELGQPPGPTPPRPLPPVPSRAQIGAVRVPFQGLTAHTTEYGSFPMFGLETTTLVDADLDAYCRQILEAGFTHGMISVSWQYAEPGFLMPVPGRDLTNDLPELVRRTTRMLANGLTSVLVFLAGDGRSRPQNSDGSWLYNDPVGHTYGHEWLMANLPRIVDAFRSAPAGDLTQRVIFCPGFDGVFYGWGNSGEPDLQPLRVFQFGQLFRQLCPTGYLAIEHTPGNIPTGSGAADWAVEGPMANFDILLSEYNNWPAVSGDYWQVVARCVQTYHTPPDQAAAAGDPSNPNHAAAVDPRPTWYLKSGNPRGPYFYVAFEYATYLWTRGRLSVADVQAARDYFRSMGVTHVC